MIIEKVDTFPLVHTLKKPYGDANGFKKYRSCFLIRITTFSGMTGWGECIDWIPTLITGFEERFIPFLLGKKVTDQTLLVSTLAKWHQRGAAAVSMALTEILAKQAGIAVYDLWGGKVWDKIPLYASFQSYSEELDWVNHSIQLVDKAVSQGFNMVKVKIGGKPLQEDWAHIQALTAQLGQQVKITLDANQSYDASTALQWEKVFRSGGSFAWFEEPIPLDQTSDYKLLRSALSVPISGGENLKKPIQFLQLLSQGAIDIIQPDVMHMEGLDVFREVSKLSRYYGVRCSPHCFDGALSRLYAIYTQATLHQWSKMSDEQIEPIEWDAMENPLTALIPLQPKNGFVKVPDDGIGICVELDEERIQSLVWDGMRYW